jgi:hypothetical protein
MKFKELFDLNESTKIKANGITAVFKDKIDNDDVVKLLNAYDTQTWAIDSFPIQKKANANNKTIISMLGDIGKGSITYKTGPSETKIEIKF